jgi:hypothetical protein
MGDVLLCIVSNFKKVSLYKILLNSVPSFHKLIVVIRVTTCNCWNDDSKVRLLSECQKGS